MRHGTEQPPRSAAPRFHEVHDASGSRLVGDVEVAPGGLTVHADGLTGTVATRQVTAILFPTDRPQPPAAAPPPACTLELLNGSEIVGSAPRLDGGCIVVALAPERNAAVPVDHVARISFRAGPGPAGASRRVVFWAEFADADQEVPNMVAALRDGLPPGWTVEADSGAEAAGLDAVLETAGVLVVPEIETFDSDSGPDPRGFGGRLRAFLDRGGTVVVAGVHDDMFAFWKETGLLALAAAERVGDGTACAFARGDPLGRDVGESFPATNATFGYRSDDAGLEPRVTAEAGGGVVLVKRVGRGAIVVLGMDYFARSPAIDRVLVNAVTQGRGR